MTHSAVDPTTLQIVPGPALSACVTTEQTIIIEEYYGSLHRRIAGSRREFCVKEIGVPVHGHRSSQVNLDLRR